MPKYKFASILLILVALTMCAVPSAFSAEKGAVHSEEIKNLKKDDTFSIPVTLENAKSLMGFKLTFTPSGDEVEVVDVKSGELTQNGLFNHNADINDGTFDVVWTGTESIGDDGIICYLQAECVEDFDSFNFEISYSQPDTFDENFDDIELICKAIELKGVVSSQATEVTNIDTDNTSISELVEVIVKNNDSENIVNKIDAVLEKYNYDLLDDVDDEHIKEFVEDFCDISEEFDLATKELDDNEKLEVLKEIYKTVDDIDKVNNDDEMDNQEKDTQDEKFTILPLKENNLFILILPIGLLAVIIISVLLIKRRKKHEKIDF